MKLVGVTGRIGTGKSTFCEILLRRYNCPLIDADALGHDALAQGGPVRGAIIGRFGRRILKGDETIDRTHLGAIVFSDPGALRDLEEIVHPWIVGQILRRVASLQEKDEAGIVLLDAAVLLDWRDRLSCDRTVLVRCPDEVSIRRLVLRGMAEEEAQRRLKRQRPEHEMARQVDFVVDNSGSREDLEREAVRLWTVWNRQEEAQ
jgi:dephospho-CoA kinase